MASTAKSEPCVSVIIEAAGGFDSKTTGSSGLLSRVGPVRVQMAGADPGLGLIRPPRERPDEPVGPGCSSFPRSALKHLHRRRATHGELFGPRHVRDRGDVRLDVLGGDVVAELLAL